MTQLKSHREREQDPSEATVTSTTVLCGLTLWKPGGPPQIGKLPLTLAFSVSMSFITVVVHMCANWNYLNQEPLTTAMTVCHGLACWNTPSSSNGPLSGHDDWTAALLLPLIKLLQRKSILNIPQPGRSFGMEYVKTVLVKLVAIEK